MAEIESHTFTARLLMRATWPVAARTAAAILALVGPPFEGAEIAELIGVARSTVPARSNEPGRLRSHHRLSSERIDRSA